MTDHLDEVADGVWCITCTFTGPGSATVSAFVLRADAGVVVVDAGARSSAATVQRALGRLAITEVGLLLLTHGHVDHAGGAAVLRAAFPGVAVHLAREDHPLVRTRRGQTSLLRRSLSPFATAQALDDVLEPVEGDLVPLEAATPPPSPLLDGALRVVATPGHTAGSTTFLDESSAIAFCGDALQGLGSRRENGPSYTDALAYRRSLQRVLRSGADTFLLGHDFQGPVAAGRGIARDRKEVGQLVASADEAWQVLHTASVALVEFDPAATDAELVRRLGRVAVSHLELAPPPGLAVPPLFGPTLWAHVRLARRSSDAGDRVGSGR